MTSTITILAIGSRGDVQPYVALGQGLQRAGYDVRIAAIDYFRDLVTSHGLTFCALSGDLTAMLTSEAATSAMEAGSNIVRSIIDLVEMVKPELRPLADDCYTASQGADLILCSTLASFGYPIGEKLGIPALPAIPYPLITPTAAFASPAWPFSWELPGTLNRATHIFAGQVAWHIFRPFLNGWIQDCLEMEPYPLWGPFREVRQSGRPILYGYSPHVIPPPLDWGANVAVTGYWFLEDGHHDWQPPADLLDFLDAGEPPVYVGFGSMQMRDPDAIWEAVRGALAQSGRRGVILASAWHDVGENALTEARGPIDEQTYVLNFAPHDWLFPQMAAVVHHGGAGTTAAGLKAGVPTVVVPFFGDQPFWGRRIKQLGVGPEPLPRADLTADRLATRIADAVTNHAMQQQATALGAAIRAEDGVGRAVQVVDTFMRHGA